MRESRDAAATFMPEHFHKSTCASALEGKLELNAEETVGLKQLWKRLVRMFHPDLQNYDFGKRKTYRTRFRPEKIRHA